MIGTYQMWNTRVPMYSPFTVMRPANRIPNRMGIMRAHPGRTRQPGSNSGGRSVQRAEGAGRRISDCSETPRCHQPSHKTLKATMSGDKLEVAVEQGSAHWDESCGE